MDLKGLKASIKSHQSQDFKLMQLKIGHGDTNGLLKATIVELNLFKLVTYMMLIHHKMKMVENC